MKVIAPKNKPTVLPLTETFICYLLIKVDHPSGVLTGVMWTCMAFLWLIKIACFAKEKYVDLFPKDGM